MRKIIAITQLSLDGVMQAPGGPKEDPSGGFAYGGWAMGFEDDAVRKALGKLISGRFDLLLGRRTYDIWVGYWPRYADNPIGKAFAKAVKYVATRKRGKLEWERSERLGPDAVAAIRRLKRSKGPALHVWGSGDLLQSLIAAGLVDEHQIWIFPVVLGRGKRLFEPGAPAHRLELAETKTGSGGVIVSTYRPRGPLRVRALAPAKAATARIGKRSRPRSR